MDIGFIKTLQQEWPTVSGAPWSVAIVAVVALGLGFGAATLYWGGTVSALRERLGLYQDRLQGASPDQAAGEIKNLKDQLANLTARRWPPLTDEESASLRMELRNFPKPQYMRILCANTDCRDLTETFVQVFRDLEWTSIDPTYDVGSAPSGISINQKDIGDRRLADAIEKGTKGRLKVIMRETELRSVTMIIGPKPSR